MPVSRQATYGVARTNFRSPALFKGSQSAIIHADVLAWAAAVAIAGGTADAGQQLALSTFINDLGATYAKLNFFWPWWVKSAVTIGGAAIDLKALQTGTFFNAPPLGDKTGIAFNGSDQYFNSGTAGDGTQDSFAFGFDLLNNRASAVASECGQGSASPSIDHACNIVTAWSDGFTYSANHDDNTSDGGVARPTDVRGIWTNSRVAAGGWTLRLDNATVNAPSIASTNNAGNPMVFGASAWASGAIVLFSVCTMGFAMMADGLDGTDISNLVSAWATYKSSL